MRPSPIRPTIDWERVALVPVFTLMLILAIGNLVVATPSRLAAGPSGWFSVANTILTAAFYVLLVWLLLTRPPAVAASSTALPRVLAYVATFLPLTISFLPEHVPHAALSSAASVVIVGGVAFSVYAVAFLGRSFSVMPQARRLVQSGPYGRVRHPLYVGECAALIGVLMASPSLPRVAVGLAVIVLQVYRALEEEKVLEGAFPEYADYRQRVKRFVPGVI